MTKQAHRSRRVDSLTTVRNDRIIMDTFKINKYWDADWMEGKALKISCYLLFFFFKIFFWCGPFLKSLLNLLQYRFCFMFWFFGLEARGILAPWPGIEPAPPALEGEALTTGPRGKSLMLLILDRLCWRMTSKFSEWKKTRNLAREKHVLICWRITSFIDAAYEFQKVKNKWPTLF